MNPTAPAARCGRRPGPSAAAAPLRSLLFTLLALAGLLALVDVAPARAAAPARAVTTTTAAASAPAAPAEDRKSTFGVQPAGPKGPDARPHFSYGVTGGATTSDRIAIWNYGEEPLTLAVYASDAVNTLDGGFDLLPAGRAPKDAGSWIKLDKDKVTVPPKGNVVVPFTVTVPRDVPPGDHTGGIVASLAAGAQDGQGNKVRLDQRVGARVYVRAAGTLTPRLEVQQVAASYEGSANPFAEGSATVTYTLRNTGNVRLGARQAVRVNGLFGTSVTAAGAKDLGDLLPGTALTITAKADGVAQVLRSSAVVSVQPVAARDGVDPKLPSLTRSVSLWTVPWALLALVLVITGGGLWVWRRRRLARAAAAAAASARRRATSDTDERQNAKKEPIVQFIRLSRRSAAGAATAAAALVGLALTVPTAAHAAPAGSARINPATGKDDSSVDVTTSAACPEPSTNILVTVAGKGFPAEGLNVVGNSPISTYAPAESGGITVPLTMTMRDYASQAGFTTLEGRYDLTVVCRKAFGTEIYGTFAASLWFTSGTDYRTTDPGTGNPTPTPTPTPSPTAPATPTPTPSASPTPTPTPTDGPTPTPSDSASPAPTPGDTASPSPTGSTGTGTNGGSVGVSTNVTGGAAGGSGGPGGGLANTGADATTIGLLSGALVLTGGGLVWWARRRGLLTFAGN
ncbi:WxL protein peptidoglycan domain-containing protein [Streptomyces sp. NPDC002104]